MKKTTTPSSPDSRKKASMPGPSKSTLMLLRMVARTYSPDPASACPTAHYALN